MFAESVGPFFFSLPVGELKQRPRPCYTTFPFVFCFFREAGCPRVVSSFMKDIKPPSILSCWAPLSSKWRIHFFSISLFRCRRLAPRENMAVVMNAADRYGCEGEKRERERFRVHDSTRIFSNVMTKSFYTLTTNNAEKKNRKGGKSFRSPFLPTITCLYIWLYTSPPPPKQLRDMNC